MFTAINRKVKRMVLRQQKKKPEVRISDTTLRDGCQSPGVRLSPEQKLTIAHALAAAGIHSIDVGFPAASPVEMESIRLIARQVKGPILSCHARTLKADIDAAAEALRGVSPLKRAVTLFIGTSPLHREHKHKMSKVEVIRTLTEAIQYAQSEFEIISFGPEDASRTEPDFLFEVYREAIAAGALSIGYTDTVGILTPDMAADTIKQIQDRVPNMQDAMLGVHFHNDLGLATANTLASIKAGANMAQGTINGIGERAGNMAIEEVVVALHLHKDEYKRNCLVDPKALTGLSALVAELTGMKPAPNKAVVGPNMFLTETGVHQSAVLQNPLTYMPFPPEMIGAGPVEVVLGPNSGRTAVRHHLEAAGLEASEEHVHQVLEALKNGGSTDAENEEILAFLEKVNPLLSKDDYEPQQDQVETEPRDAPHRRPQEATNPAL